MRIRIFIGIIEEQHGGFGFALETTSKLLGLSEARLRLIFKLETGKALSQYLREARMTEAARLVRQYKLPIKEIASNAVMIT